MTARTLENLRGRYENSGSDTTAMSGRRMGKGPVGMKGQRGMATGKPKEMKKTIARTFSYVSAYKGRMLFVVLCMLTNTLATLVAGYLLRPIINNCANVALSAADRVSSLLSMLIVLLLLYVVGVVATFLQMRIMIGVSQNAVESIRRDLFDRLKRLPVRFFDQHANGEVMSRFTNDVDNIGMMLDNSVLSLISGIVTLAGTLAMMIYTNVWLSIVTLIELPLIFKLSTVILKRSARYYSAQQAALGAVNGYIEEGVSGQKVVKVFCHEDICKEEFGLLNDDLRDKQQKAMFYGGIMMPILGNLNKVAYALTAGLGGILCLKAGFDVGGLTIFGTYASHFARPISELSQQVNTVFSALAGAERVFAIMDEVPEEADPVTAKAFPIRGDVRLEDVSFGYVPEKTILKHISLYAHPGQKIAFVGSTGAGKTTITNLLNRFYDIDAGTITVDGVNIRDIPRDHLRNNIAMVLQDTHLFTGTVRENIRYGRLDATDEEVVAAAKTASAHGFIMKLEKGYDTPIEGDGANLSQGQRQLLNIARAALSRAPILVLDEATSSVDTRTERQIERGMDSLMRDRTTFVIAHRLSTVRNADAIMVLEKGEIIERGSHEDLLKLEGRYYELYTGKSELS